MQNQSALTFLKLRAGYGKTGNDNISAFRYQDMYALDAKYEDVVAAVLQRQANPNLGWEEAYMASVGVDMTFVDRFNLTIDAYNTINKNLLLAVPTATSTGFFEFMDNVGSVRNRGIELAFDAALIKNKNFRWDFGFNIGMNQNRVLSLPDNDGDGIGDDMLQSTSEGVAQMISVGRDIYSWYMPKWYGVDTENGDPLWVLEEDENGKVISTTNEYAKAPAM